VQIKTQSEIPNIKIRQTRLFCNYTHFPFLDTKFYNKIPVKIFKTTLISTNKFREGYQHTKVK